MNKSIESLSKILFILSLFGMAYGIFNHQKMFTIYSVVGMGIGFSILAFAFNNFRIERKDLMSFCTAILLYLSCYLLYKDKFVLGSLVLVSGLLVLLYPYLSKKIDIKQA